MKRLRVLKLGWEFPPLVNGGLGIACHGLARALARHVDLTVIVPRTAANHDDDGFRLRGLNQLPASLPPQAPDILHRYEHFARVHPVPVSLDPYHTPHATPLASPPHSTIATPPGTAPTRPTHFHDNDLYGPDLANKVLEFSRLASAIAATESFDLIHAHDWMTFLAAVEIKHATGKPLVVHIHASQYDRAGPQSRGWIHDIERLGMEHADLVIPVSRYTAGILASHYGIHPAKIHPVHNGAEPVDSFTTRKKFPEKLVLFLGRLTAQKGPEFFLEIASRVIAQHPETRFVVAGTGEKLRHLIESGAFRGLGGHFHFTGFLDKPRVHELLSMTDVYCMPSVSEPFGLSALEAAQFGIPAVISKQSGVAEVLKAALKADYWDVDLMASHIVSLLTDDSLRDSVIRQARLDIAAATWDAAAERIVTLYQQLETRNSKSEI